jgi:hypothetical protein
VQVRLKRAVVEEPDERERGDAGPAEGDGRAGGSPAAGHAEDISPSRRGFLHDHRPLLADAGFELLADDETPEWVERLSRTTTGLLEAVEELAAESGSDPEEVRADLLEMEATLGAMTRRVLVVASRRRPP